MFPTRKLAGSVDLPVDATFWVPKRSEIGDEGFGYFRDVWAIVNVRVGEARALIRDELQLAHTVGKLARDAEHFDDLAHVVEGGLDWDSDIVLSDRERDILAEFVGEDEPAQIEGLELGVGGLVYALSAVGMFPAASCRGHVGARAWSDVPVVFFATDRYRATQLQALAAEGHCRFSIDYARPEMIAVSGRSIKDTMALAGAVIDARSRFKPPRGVKRHSAAESNQLKLFEL